MNGETNDMDNLETLIRWATAEARIADPVKRQQFEDVLRRVALEVRGTGKAV